ncbi:hypothetical protein HCN51_45720 [Nonomuraea sp. FMUSA5-5]|uniref:Uncharacterized protein n=1 Tax=Nonomuraea composti TaxID=2720023 RepID=A0ABX1BJG9_9ACTN|nr:hypothetical protein [Nonomuraea sp. FMUSA5-5]NJP96652.1 hypothetical protein [Nonomuraea sp. FMUSA5-5]
MTATCLERLRDCLPLRIDELSYDEPSLLLGGEGWSLSILSSWRLLDEHGRLMLGGQSKEGDVREHLRILADTQVVDVEAQSAFLPVDPRLRLSNGFVLEIFSDYPSDTWVWKVRNRHLVYVGPLSLM